MASALEEYLETLEEELEDAKTSVGTSPGPLDEPAKSQVAGNLSTAQQSIVDALAEINDVGTADPNNLPSTLPAIANECVILARDAHTESMQISPNYVSIGNDIKTIDRIIDVARGYKAKAGIT